MKARGPSFENAGHVGLLGIEAFLRGFREPMINAAAANQFDARDTGGKMPANSFRTHRAQRPITPGQTQ